MTSLGCKAPSIATSHSLGAPSIQSSSISFSVTDTDEPEKRASMRQPGHAHFGPAESRVSKRPMNCNAGGPDGSASSGLGGDGGEVSASLPVSPVLDAPPSSIVATA